MQVKTKRLPANSGLLGMASFFVMICGPVHPEEGTFAQRRACEPDVFRLCNEFIPDPAAITNCLERNKARLNPDCRAVFEGSESTASGTQHESLRKKADIVGVHKAVAR